MNSFLQWLQDTGFSGALRNSTWAEPVVETAHVLTLTFFLGFTVVLDLRLLEISLRNKRVSEVLEELNPPIIAAFCVMLASGVLLFCGDPVSFYSTVFLRVKMVIFVLAVISIWVFNLMQARRINEWDGNSTTPALAKLAAIVSLVLWAAIVAAGRAIGYAVPLHEEVIAPMFVATSNNRNTLKNPGIAKHLRAILRKHSSKGLVTLFRQSISLRRSWSRDRWQKALKVLRRSPALGTTAPSYSRSWSNGRSTADRALISAWG